MKNYCVISCLAPNQIAPPWLKSSGNEELLGVSVQYILSPLRNSRVLLIEGEGGCGLTSLLDAMKKNLFRAKLNVVSIHDGLGGDDPCMLTSLLQAIKVPLPLKGRKRLTVVAETVIKLRRLDCIIVHDIQRFCYLDNNQKKISLEALSYLGRLLPSCKFVLGGHPDSVYFFGDVFESCMTKKLCIEPMKFDQLYENFVYDAFNLMGALQARSQVDLKGLHVMSRGLVGRTFSELQHVAGQGRVSYLSEKWNENSPRFDKGTVR